MGYVLAELLQQTFSRVKMFQNICIRSIETITSITFYQHVLKNRGTKLRLVFFLNSFSAKISVLCSLCLLGHLMCRCNIILQFVMKTAN